MPSASPLDREVTRRYFLKLSLAVGVGLGLGVGYYRWLISKSGAVPLEPTLKVDEDIFNLRGALFYDRLAGDVVKCRLCFRGCVIPPGGRSFCRNRYNRDGELKTMVYGRPCSIQIDPIEKEPVFHMLPGSRIFCLAASSCNFRCRHCQNWHISQSPPEGVESYVLPPYEAVQEAVKRKCESVSFTFSEPTVSYEYMLDTFRQAKDEGLRTIIHTNGVMRSEPMRELCRHLDAVTVDLKGFTQKFYGEVSSAELSPVLDTLKLLSEQDVWLEVVNLIIPTYNDDMADIEGMCDWLLTNVGDVPLHFNRFHPHYKLTNLPPTPLGTLEKAKKIADEAGLSYVYIGNMPGHRGNSTYCPGCQRVLVKRTHFAVLENNLEDGKCRFCGAQIPGRWS